MSTATRKIQLHKAQQNFCRSKSIYRGFVGGRGAGKSWVGCYDLIRRSKSGRTYLVAAPDYTTLWDTTFKSFVEVGTLLGVLEPENIKRSKPPEATLNTGAHVIFRSMDDPERRRGSNLSGAFLDEASLMDKAAYDIIIANLREAGEMGWLSACFTPKGMLHWTYDYFGKCRSDTELFHSATKDNPFLPPEFASTVAKQYGADTALGRQELQGEFISEDDDIWQVIPTTWVLKAQARWTSLKPEGVKLSCLGVDVARGGDDRTAIIKRYGNWFARPLIYPGKDTPDGPSVATLVIRAHEDDAQVNIDVIGIGSSAYDVLKENRWLTVRAVNNAEGKVIRHLRDRTRRFKFTNVRAASWWKLREALDPDLGDDLALPPGTEVLAELCTPHYKIVTGGIQIESKDDIKERLGRSPDVGDALVLSHWQPTWHVQGIRTITLRLGGKQRVARDIYCCAKDDIDFDADETNTLAINIHTTPSEDILDQCINPIARVHLNFPDIDPRDYRSRWNEPLPEYDGKTVTEAMLDAETAKTFVKEVQADRSRRWQHLLIVDDTDGRRAKSAACAAADILSLPRSFCWWPGKDTENTTVKLEPPNASVYTTLKAARAYLCA